MKVVMQLPRESLKNCFLSLALPSVVFSEPAAAQTTVINDKLSYTLWDKWEVKGHKAFKLQDFLKAIKVMHIVAATCGDGQGNIKLLIAFEKHTSCSHFKGHFS